ncbi:MFS transporter [Paraoerskovia sediminicola]|uniref:MFS transporter n=1 Tax=Paraoerskovia sediminicola TaxID=1138587 RepID=A0ABM8G0H1_9CELL|nr:MFS transporter [Paraoerskovia sediminicola]
MTGFSVWMQRLVQDWLVLELTGSSAAVGVTVALQFLPMLLVGPAFGLVADRHDKRRLVQIATAVAALLGFALAALVLSGSAQPWHLYVFAVLLGLVTAMDQPTRQALVGEIVGDSRLRTAVSTNNVVAQLSGMIAPAVAGVLIHSVGEGWSFVVTASLALVGLALLSLVRTAASDVSHRLRPAPGQIREGFRYVVQHPTLRWVFVLAGCIGAFGMNGPVVLTAFAETEWGSGATGFGLYNSASAVGAMTGAVIGARVRSLDMRLVVWAAAIFGAVEIVAALMPTELAFVVALIAVGAATLLFITSAASLVQLTAPAAMRGRVLAIYSPVLLGGHAVGGLVAGALTESIGVREGLVVVGVLAMVSALVTAIAVRGRREDGGAPPPH